MNIIVPNLLQHSLCQQVPTESSPSSMFFLYMDILYPQALNTFQIVLVTDGQMSFVLFIYGEIQWGFANVGFNAGDGTRFFMVPGALTADAISIETDSNVGLPGLYIYRVDLIEVLEPDGMA